MQRIMATWALLMGSNSLNNHNVELAGCQGLRKVTYLRLIELKQSSITPFKPLTEALVYIIFSHNFKYPVFPVF